MSGQDGRWFTGAVALSSLADFVTLVDADLVIRYINHPVPGLDMSSVLGAPMLLFVDPAFHDVARSCTAKVMVSGERGVFESVAQGPDGTMVWYENRVAPVVHDGVVVGASIHGVPITAKKEVEQALAHSEGRFLSMFEQHGSVMLILDAEDLSIVDANNAAARFYGYTREQLRTMTARDINPASALEINATRQRVLDRRASRFHFVHRVAGGALKAVEVHATAIESGGRQLLFAIIRDITEQLAAEEQRVALEEQLLQSQKMDAVGRLAGGIAHDFNNLLTVMNANTELMQRACVGCHDKVPLIQDIADAASRATKLTRQLLSFSRKQLFQPQPLYLDALLNDLQSLLASTLGASIELAVRVDDAALVVKADANQLQQVIVNLVVNARDAMSDGGKLVLGLTQRAVAGQGPRDGDYAVLSVTDTGEGMDEATLQRVFEPFFTTKPEGKGTGLGLAVVYGIVEQHGGFVTVRSDLGKGTCFEVFLRTTRELPAVDGRSANGVNTTIFSGTVLLVEDEEPVRRVGVRLLRRLGFVVVEASGGDEALRVLEDPTQPLDLLVTDVMMPGMRGDEVARLAVSLRPSLPVLFMSGYDANHVTKQGLIGDDLNFVSKPFSVLQLSEAVERALSPQSKTSSK